MGRYSIKEIEHLTGIKAHTIRIWEQRYKLLEPERTDTNIRYYNDEQLKRILNVSLLNKHGFKISSILKMSDAEIGNNIMNLQKENLSHDETQIAALTHCLLDLDERGFEKQFNTLILQHGFEKSIAEFVFPFLNKVGVLWSLGSITPMHEHFVTNIIRRKILVAIDAQHVVPVQGSQKVILFLPEHEWHELGLLFAEYLLRKRNHHVLYLGSAVPFTDLRKSIKLFEPDLIFGVFTVESFGFNIKQYISELLSINQQFKLAITGAMALNNTEPVHKRIVYLHSIIDTIQYFDSLKFADKNIV